MGRVIIFLGVTFLFFTACKNNNFIKENIVKEGIIQNHSINKIFIEIDSLCLPFEYYQRFDYYTSGNKTYFAGYNNKTNAIDIINLSDNEPPQHLVFDSQGPDGIANVDAFNIISHDSILIADISKFSIINRQGKIRWKMKREYPTPIKDLPTGYLSADIDFQPGFIGGRRSIIVKYNPFVKDSLVKIPLLAEINIESNEIKLLPIYRLPYLDKFKNGCPVSLDAQASFTDDKIVLNFPFTSNIYDFRFDAERLSVHGGKSSYTANMMPLFENDEDPTEYILRSICFFKPVIDQYHKFIYRIHHGEMQPTGQDYLSDYYNKPVYMTVFDYDYNYLYETLIDISPGIVPLQVIPGPNGVIVFPLYQPSDALESNRLIAYLIKFD